MLVPALDTPMISGIPSKLAVRTVACSQIGEHTFTQTISFDPVPFPFPRGNSLDPGRFALTIES